MFIALLGTMKNTLLYNLYEYDRSFFIESFCVNKDRPQLHCDGKCKLAQMRREDDEKKAGDLMQQLQSEMVFFFPVQPLTIRHQNLAELKTKAEHALYRNHLFSYLFISKSIKPPEIA